LPAFSFVKGPTIRIVDKLDLAFAMLLNMRNYSLTPAGDMNNFLVSVTDRVRIRSVIERTRLLAVEISEGEETSEGIADSDFGSQAGPEDVCADDKDSLDMSISSMYERTLTILGDSLG
jgi:Subunit 11 of the general transcription factor TFIIH